MCTRYQNSSNVKTHNTGEILAFFNYFCKASHITIARHENRVRGYILIIWKQYRSMKPYRSSRTPGYELTQHSEANEGEGEREVQDKV